MWQAALVLTGGMRPAPLTLMRLIVLFRWSCGRRSLAARSPATFTGSVNTRARLIARVPSRGLCSLPSHTYIHRLSCMYIKPKIPSFFVFAFAGASARTADALAGSAGASGAAGARSTDSLLASFNPPGTSVMREIILRPTVVGPGTSMNREIVQKSLDVKHVSPGAWQGTISLSFCQKRGSSLFFSSQPLEFFLTRDPKMPKTAA